MVGLSLTIVVFPQRRHDGLDVPLVAELQHPVGLVQDDPPHRVQLEALRLPDMVQQPGDRLEKGNIISKLEVVR